MVDYREDTEYKSKIEKREEATSSFICPKKHFVRIKGWLDVAKKRREKVSSRNETDGYIRYFTLCGREAIDVLLFERESIIRATTRGYPDVCYCDFSEDAPLEFAKLKEALGKTKGFNMRFQNLVYDSTFIELVRKEPFDVINLDFCGSCFPRYEAPDSATLRAIERILQLQSSVSFDLFVTFRAQRSLENSEAIQELENAMTKNFDDFDEIKEAYNANVGRSLRNLSDNDYHYFLIYVFPKIILGFGINYGLNGNCLERFYYQRRRGQYRIVKFIFSFELLLDNNERFSRRSRRSIELAERYPIAIINYLKNKPIDVDRGVGNNRALQNELKEDQMDLIKNKKKFRI